MTKASSHGEQRQSRVSNHALSLLLVLALTACAPKPPPLPPTPVPAGPGITLQIAAVPLNPDDPKQERIGNFVFAGGIALTSTDTSRLHGLSDLKILPDGTVLAVGDDGDFFEAKLQLDESERLIGLTDAKIMPLAGIEQGKEHGDAEGLAVLANGDRLVSFERNHRILLYPADGGPPRPAPFPKTLFSDNEGMEALTQYPQAGADAYLVGGEEGEMWLCRAAGACALAPAQPLPGLEFGQVALAAFEGTTVAVLARAYDPVRGSRLRVSIVTEPLKKGSRLIDTFAIEAPLTRDNFEGLAAVRNKAGGARFYLLSDDNFNPSQRTLLLAFDWVPK